jgi:hypothetical protein
MSKKGKTGRGGEGEGKGGEVGGIFMFALGGKFYFCYPHRHLSAHLMNINIPHHGVQCV